MSLLTDQHYLKTSQYKDESNLNARVSLHQRFSTNDQSWQRWVFDHLHLSGQCDVLDVGCGPGHLWLENADRIPNGWVIVLSDLSSGILQRAWLQLEGSGHRFVYRVLDAQAMPFLDRSFDVVVANHVLFHLPSICAGLREITRVLRPGGYLYAATHGSKHMMELHDIIRGFCPDVDIPTVVSGFGLENGAAQLAEHFPHVQRHRQENALVVTEAEALVAYALSMACAPALGRHRDALLRAFQAQIAQTGAIHIQKDSGLFVARKAEL